MHAKTISMPPWTGFSNASPVIEKKTRMARHLHNDGLALYDRPQAKVASRV